MNTTIRPVRRINQRLHNLLKLILLTMQQQRIKKLTSPIITIRTITQHLQSSRIRSIRTGFGLLRGFQTHIFKQNFLQLFGTLQIHPLARILPGRFLRMIRIGGKLFAHVHQPVHIDLRAGMLHAIKHTRYWNLHGIQQGELLTLIQRIRQISRQQSHNRRVTRKLVVFLLHGFFRLVEIKRSLRRTFRLLLDMQIQKMSRRLFQSVGMEIGMDQIPGKFGIEQRFRQLHADASQQMGLFLIAMHHHGLVVFVK